MKNMTSFQRRKQRVKAHIGPGTAARPRLAVYRSNASVVAQLIDDEQGITLAAAHSLKEKAGGNVAAATKVGEEIAKKAKEKKVSTVIFDRSGYRFHGRVKALAEAARKGGLQF